MSVTIYHNPRCSKSRATLALLAERGVEHTVIRYLETPPSVAELKKIVALLGISPRDLIRTGEDEYRANGLDDMTLSDSDLLQAMHDHPRLIQRPIVVSKNAARIGRPPECVLEVLGAE